ncbi:MULTISPECIES: DUF6094 domain-containing protein [Thermus]|uniref:DUF6094 domain-containing protein n=2 Tax=Thermus TaxID=270 RepID=H9ZV19_THETH|nr:MULTISPECIES: DUF6094 domain-containing protein [Thermus]AFH40179.1 hypothetical protein TtJL18_2351 [Thermus thermophilus JL-18]AFV77463.1 hypothetical protein Theos_2488 [Thermus oshimai JL-2]
MRLEAVAKAGFYPTPPRTLSLVVELLKGHAPHLRGLAALDPCAGEGEALKEVGRALGMSTYGIELDVERAARARKVLDRVIQGDALQYRASGFGLLWLNPPYDWGEGGVRLEEAFLREYLESTLPGGVMVLVVPEKVLPRLWPILTSAYGPLLVARLPRGEWEVFRQVVVVAERLPLHRAVPQEWVHGDLPHLEDLPGIPSFTAQGYLEEAASRIRPRVWAVESLDPSLALEMARRSPLWSEVEGERGIVPRPLLPLKEAHLALLLAGGVLDLEEVVMEGVPHLILGVLEKETVEVEGERDGEEVELEVFRMAIKALNLLTGELLEVR